MQKVSLYFTLNTPFHEFQQVLRNETKLSTIPPLEIVKPDALPWSSVERSTSPELPHGGSNASDYSSSRRGSIFGENAQSRQPSVSSPSTKMPVQTATQSRRPSRLLSPTTARGELGSPASKKAKSTLPGPRPRSTSMKGYSLDDGPWTYRIYNMEDPRIRNPYIELNDEEGYLEMMYNLKDAIKKSPGAQHRVMFWHVSIHIRPLLHVLRCLHVAINTSLLPDPQGIDSLSNASSQWISQQSMNTQQRQNGNIGRKKSPKEASTLWIGAIRTRTRRQNCS